MDKAKGKTFGFCPINSALPINGRVSSVKSHFMTINVFIEKYKKKDLTKDINLVAPASYFTDNKGYPIKDTLL